MNKVITTVGVIIVIILGIIGFSRLMENSSIIKPIINVNNPPPQTMPTSTPPTATSTATTTPTTPPPSVGITMTEVMKHDGRSSCYAVVNAKVYDLTTWISQHPGGADNILKICGKDGTSLFTLQHGGDTKPETVLASFYLAPLAK